MAASGRSLNRELNPACGRFSLSPGEKAGMRADNTSTKFSPAFLPPAHCPAGTGYCWAIELSICDQLPQLILLVSAAMPAA